MEESKGVIEETMDNLLKEGEINGIITLFIIFIIGWVSIIYGNFIMKAIGWFTLTIVLIACLSILKGLKERSKMMKKSVEGKKDGK